MPDSYKAVIAGMPDSYKGAIASKRSAAPQ
jgi:hypothetical protein